MRLKGWRPPPGPRVGILQASQPRRSLGRPLRPRSAEPLRLALSSAWTTTRRNERRYLFDDVGVLLTALKQQKLKPRRYAAASSRVETIYLGGTGAGFQRLRRYDGQPPWFLEIKQRQGIMVTKRRRRCPNYSEDTACGVSLDRDGRLRSSYRRVAYEFGGLRLTIDSGIRFSQGSKRVRFSGYVVEVKGQGAQPQWLRAILRGHAAPDFGKRLWAQRALKSK